MKYTDAAKQLRRVGAANAQRDALRAMYAQMIASHQGGNVVQYYRYLQEWDTQGDDKAVEEVIRKAALPLMQNRAKAWEVLMGIFS